VIEMLDLVQRLRLEQPLNCVLSFPLSTWRRRQGQTLKICRSYFRCRTAGYKSISGRSCNRPPRHRFFLVFLCL